MFTEDVANVWFHEKIIGYDSLMISWARCSSVVRAFAHGAMGRWIDPSWGGPIEIFLIPAMLHDWCNKACGMW